MPNSKNLIHSQPQIMELESHKLRYEVVFSKRKTIQLVLKAADPLVIKAPIGVELSVLVQLVVKHRKWLLKHMERLAANPYAERPCFENGAIHYFLGQPYTLSLQFGAGKRFNRTSDRFLITVPTPALAETLLYRFYTAEAKSYFPQRLTVLWKQFVITADRLYPAENWPGHPFPSLSIRRMKSRFGSMTTQNRLTLNSELIRVNPCYIDYVILHELCHLKYMDHSKNFYALLETQCPDWRILKQQLFRLLSLG